MASKNNAGVNPLGNKPFSKVKLEGPKKHQDNHGNSASVPERGNKRAVGNEHWEMGYNMSAGNGSLPSGAFSPKQSKNRPQPFNKVNDCDH